MQDDESTPNRRVRRLPPQPQVVPLTPKAAEDGANSHSFAFSKTFRNVFGENAAGDAFLYDEETGEWWSWHDGRWHIDTPRARRVMHNIIDGSVTDAKARARLFRWHTITGSLAVAGTFLGCRGSQRFDGNPHLLGLPSGMVFNLSTNSMMKPAKDLYVSKSAGADPDFKTPPAHWLAFLNEAFEGFGGEREQAIYWLRWWLRDALHGRASHAERFPFLQGTAGTGKSTLVTTVRALFGEYAWTISGEKLLEGMHAHRQWLMPLRFARLATVTELQRGAWKSELVNELVSGESITANAMRRNDIVFSPRTHLLVAGNEQPRSGNPGVFRRMALFPMHTVPAKPDTELKAKLLKELPSILGWVLGAAPDEPPLPSMSVAAKEAYREAADVLAGWLAENCHTAPDAYQNNRELHANYTAYCVAGGERAMGLHAWGRAMGERGYGHGQTPDGKARARRGVAIRTP